MPGLLRSKVSDFTARLLAQRLTENLGQQIVVDNRTGGVGMELVGGTPAHFDQVIKADTDRMSKVIKAAGIRAE